MNQVEIYRKMRTWELYCECIVKLKNELKLYENGLSEVIDPDVFSLIPETVETRSISILNKIKDFKFMNQEIAKDLFDQDIDVEYIVKEAYPNLKRVDNIRDCFIIQNKKELGTYFYSIRSPHMDSPDKGHYETLSDVVTEVLSSYSYLGDEVETIQSAMDRLEKVFEEDIKMD
ncbi:hypothetical protein ACFQZE_07095 [Paenibacillus sp. GCM10027627]|uniref:hypothetical protein n=1 Tax=unclassified Paenibacillus TaxID=185978 RepID=UPI003628D3BF